MHPPPANIWATGAPPARVNAGSATTVVIIATATTSVAAMTVTGTVTGNATGTPMDATRIGETAVRLPPLKAVDTLPTTGVGGATLAALRPGEAAHLLARMVAVGTTTPLPLRLLRHPPRILPGGKRTYSHLTPPSVLADARTCRSGLVWIYYAWASFCFISLFFLFCLCFLSPFHLSRLDPLFIVLFFCY